MCKIVTFTNSKNLDIEKISNEIGNILLKTERDGFGYAVQSKSGVYGEKTIDTNFKSRIKSKVKIPLSIVKQKYESFGNYTDDTGAMILHGRVSTNTRGLKNCHPIIRDKHYLIHNGVVTDHGESYNKLTSNDSEDVLFRFMKGIQEVERNLTGYYAFSCLDSEGRLHIVRDSIATLFVAWCSINETFIFATTKELLNKVVKAIGGEINYIDEVQDDVYMIFKDNQLVHTSRIESRGFTTVESAWSEQSLGRKLTNEEPEPNFYDNGNFYAFYDPEEMEIDDIDLKDAFKWVDDTYLIWDKDGIEMDNEEFHKLDYHLQKKCYLESTKQDKIFYAIHKSKLKGA